ncbi:hypothetical protein KJ365_12155 [Glaciecola sp. XM2]|jgi:hypothetical protein|uniref:DUF6489 family protein n=1 Tax=Glaciecola sp. XM2 TaxID=1914931 RepID=UPI001BDE2D39|nr:DUF6489 family protein [Glaciecola sp. XM2]MBT1451635.1 hypothetical protein [Glaciecola sp. XM2]
MKVTVNIELSPAEAREMFGLPDFSDIHQSLTEDLLNKCQQDPQSAFETFIKPSLETGMSGFTAYQNMMANFMQGQMQPQKSKE